MEEDQLILFSKLTDSDSFEAFQERMVGHSG